MKLSTKSRYGTRLVLDMAQHYSENYEKSAAIPLSDIAKRQEISAKYLEQIIITLKKAKYIKSIRGAKGGYLLLKDPKKITIGEIVELFEGGTAICECNVNSKTCPKSKTCVTRKVWESSAKAMFDKLNSITFSDLIK